MESQEEGQYTKNGCNHRTEKEENVSLTLKLQLITYKVFS